MQEQQHQIKIYGFFQKLVYAVVAMECITLFFLHANVPVLSKLLEGFAKMGIFSPPINAKISTLILIAIVAAGTKAKKKQDLNIVKSIILPIIFGVGMMVGSLFLIPFPDDKSIPNILPGMNVFQIGYALLSFGSYNCTDGCRQHLEIYAAENGERPMECGGGKFCSKH